MGIWQQRLLEFLKSGNSGGREPVAPAAYDTAWVARLRDPARPDQPAFPACLEWLLAHQNPDGSWGSSLHYYHDRAISTMAALVTLCTWRGWVPDAQERIRRAETALNRDLTELYRDPYATVGFELVLPRLWRDAERLGLRLVGDVLPQYRAARARKLAQVPACWFYSPQIPTTYSLECLDETELDVERALQLQAEDGSLVQSPAATASYLLQQPDLPEAWAYLRRLAARFPDGGMPPVEPVDIYEPAWSLYNAFSACPRELVLAAARPLLDHLRETWQPGGVSYSSRRFRDGSTFAADLDDTAMAMHALRRMGVAVDPQAILNFEEPGRDHFRCFNFETEPSVSANVHLLHALRHDQDLGTLRPRIVAKILKFLAAQIQGGAMIWLDKWSSSPVYATAHYVLAMADAANDPMTDGAVYWVMWSQLDDGSWGFLDKRSGGGTAEETAYCLQALLAWHQAGHKIEMDQAKRAADYLMQAPEFESHSYRPQFIAKVLYSPTGVVEGAVLSALAMYEALCE